MKHKKDIPRKYWKYVMWAVFDKDGKVNSGMYSLRGYALLHKDKRFHETVHPVLCLPLSMLKSGNCILGTEGSLITNGST